MNQLDLFSFRVRRVHHAPALIQLHTIVQATDGRPAVRGAAFVHFTNLFADVNMNRGTRPQYLIGKGISPQRLVAAGFGEFQPLDPGTSDDAYRRNRRIELKLTER